VPIGLGCSSSPGGGKVGFGVVAVVDVTMGVGLAVAADVVVGAPLVGATGLVVVVVVGVAVVVGVSGPTGSTGAMGCVVCRGVAVEDGGGLPVAIGPDPLVPNAIATTAATANPTTPVTATTPRRRPTCAVDRCRARDCEVIDTPGWSVTGIPVSSRVTAPETPSREE